MLDAINRRLALLKKSFIEAGLDAVIINQGENRKYYSGFTGSNGILVITRDKNYLLTDGRYISQAAREAPLFEIVLTTKQQAKDVMARFGSFMAGTELGNKIGFEANVVTVGPYRKYFDLLTSQKGIFFADADELILSPRLVKDTIEIDEIRKAISIAEAAFEKIVPMIVPGNTERQVSAMLDYQMILGGAQNQSFDTIIGSGENGALPHAKLSDREFREGDAVVVDWGALTDSGYHSDCTRTLFAGEPDPEMLNVYKIVSYAQKTALEKIKPGMTTGEADAIARDIIKEAGFGEYYIHGMGHGVGLAIHEGPTLNEFRTEILAPGMVVTVEPGIYIPGKGGVRIEDMIVITDTGCQVLTTVPKIEY